MCQVHVHQGHPLNVLGMESQRSPIGIGMTCFRRLKRYLKLGDANSFELPWNNDIWSFALCQKTLKNAGHNYNTKVRLCKTGFVTKEW